MKPDIGIYVHIPYCLSKCPYCDFNSYAVGNDLDAEANYVSALLAEVRYYTSLTEWQNRACRSIFFGGGTPSLFSANSIHLLLQEFSKFFELTPATEITLEANPGTIQEQLGEDKLRDFRQAGVNRISMGGQSFSERKLQLLGRLHSPRETLAAVENIRRAGFENFNIDVIFGVRDESLAEWQADLAQMLTLNPPHISAYCLTIEPGTDFGKQTKRGANFSASEELQGELFRETQNTLGEAGYEQYEVSNYARPCWECRHNFSYWRGHDYLGLGAGAHSYLSTSESERQQTSTFGYRWANIPGPSLYIERAKTKGDASQNREVLYAEQAELEFFFLGLRTKEGISKSRYEELFGASFDSRFASLLNQFAETGLLQQDERQVCLTPNGLLFTDSILGSLSGLAARSLPQKAPA